LGQLSRLDAPQLGRFRATQKSVILIIKCCNLLSIPAV
jgi:hypothetical protein